MQLYKLRRLPSQRHRFKNPAPDDYATDVGEPSSLPPEALISQSSGTGSTFSRQGSNGHTPEATPGAASTSSGGDPLRSVSATSEERDEPVPPPPRRGGRRGGRGARPHRQTELSVMRGNSGGLGAGPVAVARSARGLFSDETRAAAAAGASGGAWGSGNGRGGAGEARSHAAQQSAKEHDLGVDTGFAPAELMEESVAAPAKNGTRGEGLLDPGKKRRATSKHRRRSSSGSGSSGGGAAAAAAAPAAPLGLNWAQPGDDVAGGAVPSPVSTPPLNRNPSQSPPHSTLIDSSGVDAPSSDSIIDSHIESADPFRSGDQGSARSESQRSFPGSIPSPVPSPRPSPPPEEPPQLRTPPSRDASWGGSGASGSGRPSSGGRRGGTSTGAADAAISNGVVATDGRAMGEGTEGGIGGSGRAWAGAPHVAGNGAHAARGVPGRRQLEPADADDDDDANDVVHDDTGELSPRRDGGADAAAANGAEAADDGADGGAAAPRRWSRACLTWVLPGLPDLALG